MKQQPRKQDRTSATEFQEIREKIAKRLRATREKLPELGTAQLFAQKLGKSAAYVSRLEAGAKSVPSEVLVWMAKQAKIAPWELFFGEEVRPMPPFLEAAAFLQRANEMGIVSLETDREKALNKLVPFVEALEDGTVEITGSTLRGLRQKPNYPFVVAVAKKRETQQGRQRFFVRILFTHLEQALLREDLEGRTCGAIANEVVEGIVWTCDTWGLDWKKDIKLVKAPPALFSVFVSDKEQVRGMGIANLYPLMTQAYVSPGVVIQHTGNVSEIIYETLHRSNFVDPWRSDKISLTVDQAIQDIENMIGKEKPQESAKNTALRTAVGLLKAQLDRDKSEESQGKSGPVISPRQME